MMLIPRWHRWYALLQTVKSAWLVEVKNGSIYGVAKDVLLDEILSLHAQSTEI